MHCGESPKVPSPEDKIFNLDEIVHKSEILKMQKKKVVTTNGCFDLLHRGHIHTFVEARKLGDALFVGINSDASVSKLKGPNRPLQSEQERLYSVAALECVDGVFCFSDSTPVAWLEKIRPNVHVKGGDYEGKELPESETVRKHGGRVTLIPSLPGFSTTALIQKIKKLS